MQIQVDIGFDELLEVINRLPENQLILLKNAIERKPETNGNASFKNLLLTGPTMSEKQIDAMKEARNSIDKWREI